MCDSGELPVGNGGIDDGLPTTPENCEDADMTVPWPKPPAAASETLKTLDFTVSEQEYDGSSFFSTACPISQKDRLKSQCTDDEGAMDMDYPDSGLAENSDINENAMQKINSDSSRNVSSPVDDVSKLTNNVISTIIEQTSNCDSNIRNNLGKVLNVQIDTASGTS